MSLRTLKMALMLWLILIEKRGEGENGRLIETKILQCGKGRPGDRNEVEIPQSSRGDRNEAEHQLCQFGEIWTFILLLLS